MRFNFADANSEAVATKETLADLTVEKSLAAARAAVPRVKQFVVAHPLASLAGAALLGYLAAPRRSAAPNRKVATASPQALASSAATIDHTSQDWVRRGRIVGASLAGVALQLLTRAATDRAAQAVREALLKQADRPTPSSSRPATRKR